MAFDTLLFEQRDHIAHVTLNRPDKFNALNVPLIEELRAVAAAIAAEPRLRAVLLTGAGRGFCSGADLTADALMQKTSRSLGETVGDRLLDHFNPMVAAWYALRVPLVVAVNGVAAGAGMSLALLGDIVIAARSASFLQLFAPKLGLMPDLGSTFFLPRMIGTARAKGLAMLGEALSADDAAKWGLIWACVPDDVLLEQAETLARRFADGPTQAFGEIKSAFNRQPAATLPEQLALETIAQARLGDTQDFAEGVRAFQGKRAPKFIGR
jgi:2-(1,2-epoxy-1,2-dihydrophenyl)acetyl-CoA isomerase